MFFNTLLTHELPDVGLLCVSTQTTSIWIRQNDICKAGGTDCSQLRLP